MSLVVICVLLGSLLLRTELLCLRQLVMKFCQWMLSEAGGAVFIMQEFEDIFKETKQGFDGKSPTLTHSIT